MEIHPPHRPITSVKELLRELLVITAGILIALGFQALIESRLAREARTNILNELAENRGALKREQLDLDKMRRQAEELVNLIHELQANRKTPVHKVSYIFSIAELHSTSWDTAKATGALQFLPYAAVKRYTTIYDLQQAFELLEQRGFAASLEVEALETLVQRGTSTLSTAELADAERRVGIALVTVNAMQEFAVQLGQQYDELLSSASERR